MVKNKKERLLRLEFHLYPLSSSLTLPHPLTPSPPRPLHLARAHKNLLEAAAGQPSNSVGQPPLAIQFSNLIGATNRLARDNDVLRSFQPASQHPLVA